jgi:COP9 signalosome complex subunit 2
MSDEEWEDEPKAPEEEWGGGDEDDWGGEDDDWGDGGGDNVDEEQGDDSQIAIENLFYQAESQKKRDPLQALSGFLESIALEEKKMPDQVFMRFKALRHVVEILLTNHASGNELVVHYRKLLEIASTSQVTRNDSNDAINAVLVAAGESSNEKAAEALYQLTISHLQSDTSSSGQRLYFSVVMKLCRKLFDKEEYARCESLLSDLHGLCRNPDGTDDLSKGSQLLEIYALEVQLLSLTGNQAKLRQVFSRTKGLNSEINDPRSMSIIQECWGKSYAFDGDWDQAFSEFWEAFLQYQQLGSPRAKQCLKYVVLANILSTNSTNPFNTREAKVYEQDPDISVVIKLLNAYEAHDVRAMEGIISEYSHEISSDSFIYSNVSILLYRTRIQAIAVLVRPYRRISIGFIANYLNISEKDTEMILTNMILDEQISGKIDQLHRVLDLSPEELTGKKYATLSRWSDSILQRISDRSE